MIADRFCDASRDWGKVCPNTPLKTHVIRSTKMCGLIEKTKMIHVRAVPVFSKISENTRIARRHGHFTSITWMQANSHRPAGHLGITIHGLLLFFIPHLNHGETQRKPASHGEPRNRLFVPLPSTLPGRLGKCATCEARRTACCRCAALERGRGRSTSAPYYLRGASAPKRRL